jgi:hypothetical protein
MKIEKNIKKTYVITTILVLKLSTILTLLPLVMAQEPLRVTPYAYIGAQPNPVGVNQATLLHVGITYPTVRPQLGWEDLTVEVEDPTGQIEILGPVDTDTTGGTGLVFTPTMVGTYRLRTIFPENTNLYNNNRAGPAGTILEPTTSEWLELEVTEEPAPEYPGHTLPSEYWTRPIDSQMWEWASISGNYLEYVKPTASSPHNIVSPNNDYAPETGHILWAKPITRMGGLAGGIYERQSFDCGDAYEGKFLSSVIIAGVLYYNRFGEMGRGGLPSQGVVAVDLHTGEELWFRNNTRISFGQMYYFSGFNYHAVFAYLWEVEGDTWNAYDPSSGEWVYSMTDVPDGERMNGPNGEILIYTVEDSWMSLWNSSLTIQPQDRGDSWDGSWGRHLGRDSEFADRIYPAERGIQWNVSIPELPGSVQKVREGVIVGSTISRSRIVDNPHVIWAISTKPGQEGTLMWQKTWNIPASRSGATVEDVSVEEDVFVVSIKETRQVVGFRLSTGEQIWGPNDPQHYQDNWGYSSSNSWDIIAEDKLLSGNYGGIVYCYDVQTGALLWNYEIKDVYNAYLFNTNWRLRYVSVADGKVYIEHNEHSVVDPKPRGAPLTVLDLETGDLVFDINLRGTEWGGLMMMADSIFTLYNSYDQRIYTIGKGPSMTNVEAPMAGVTVGSTCTIRGTVKDVSPGTEASDLKLRFPNGVPAVSDESQSEWMEYVYLQHERPMDTIGATVKLEAVDPNGNYQNLGTTITDTAGKFGFSFEPEIEGQHMIIATFEGSKSYYTSLIQHIYQLILHQNRLHQLNLKNQQNLKNLSHL